MGTAAKKKTRDLPVHESPTTSVEDALGLVQMVEWITRLAPTSGANALRELRTAFPDTTLELRVAALNALIQQQGGDTTYIPR